jgi:BirA family transcriptional regulator, biotin operon repressor / biotin---[acetyl-CoA-carboxylase] ligase
MSKPFSTPSNERLDAAGLRAALVTPGSEWSALDVVAETGSTNADLLAAARAGAAHGTVLAAEHQASGRGRQGRTWATPPAASALTFSVLLRPAGIPVPGRSWLPLLAGVAAARALRAGPAVDAVLKWPNDVLAGGAKLAGILAEQAGDAIVVGIGINVGARREDLPPPGPGALPPTSLALLGAASTDRTALLTAVLAELAGWYRRWTRAGDATASGLRAEYLRRCATIGTAVRVELPGGGVLTGTAAGIGPAGQLIVDTAGGPVPVSAGDVIHVRGMSA